MRKPIWIVLILVLLTVLLTGCSGKPDDFTDDFSDPSSGWRRMTGENFAQGYVNGQYVFQIFDQDWFVWATGDTRYTDVVISVTTTMEGRQQDNHMGLICRAQGDEFYYFAISADGYYGIYRRESDGNFIPLTGISMQRSDAILKGATSNKLSVSCVEDALSLFVNGTQVAVVSDDTLTKGTVGMAAGTLTSDENNFWFDDLAVSIP